MEKETIKKAQQLASELERLSLKYVDKPIELEQYKKYLQSFRQLIELLEKEAQMGN